MKVYSFLLSILALSTAVAQPADKPFGYKKSCPEITVPTPPRSLEEMKSELAANNITAINTVSPSNVEHFLAYYKKFPESLRSEMVNRGARISIMEGKGVTADPSFSSEKTFDGRNWDEVPGSGGEVSKDFNIPTRIVVNHLHDHHGATNLLLHEHAHTLDSLYGRNSLSNTGTWSKLLSDTPNSKEFLEMLCSADYCSAHKEEAFAELFAYYHSCEATRKHMEQSVPMIAEFFKNFSSGKALLEGKVTIAPPANVVVPQEPQEECAPSPLKDNSSSVQDIADVHHYMNKEQSKSSTKSVSLPSTYPSLAVPLRKSGSAGASGF